MSAGGLVRGDITVDGHPKVHETFRRIASYVEQVSLTAFHKSEGKNRFHTGHCNWSLCTWSGLLADPRTA